MILIDDAINEVPVIINEPVKSTNKVEFDDSFIKIVTPENKTNKKDDKIILSRLDLFDDE